MGNARNRLLAGLAAVSVAVVPLLASGAPPAAAVESGGAASQPTLPAATSSQMWQTNAPVYKLAWAADPSADQPEVWAAGPFTQLHAPGSAACYASSTGLSPACPSSDPDYQYLAAFYASGAKAGSPLPFNYTFSGSTSGATRNGPLALGVSPDGSTLYVGGNFTTITNDSPGASSCAAQPQTFTGGNLVAVNTADGCLDTSWMVKLGSYVSALAVSPGGSTEGDVYVAGPFGLAYQWDTTSGPNGCPSGVTPPCWRGYGAEMLAAFGGVGQPNAGQVVEPFTFDNGYNNSGSSSPQTGPASTDGPIFALAVSPDGTRLYVGGNQTEMDGATSDPAYDVTINGSSVPLPLHNIAELNTTTGVVNDFPANTAMMAQDYQCGSSPCTSSNSGCCWSQVKDIVPDAATNTVYISAEGTGGGIFDGDFAAHISTGSSDPTPDGTLLWMNGCLGATQAIQMVNGWLYKGSHAHNCQELDNTPNPNGVMYLHDPDAFPQVPHAGARHLLVQDPTTGRLGPWYPDTNGMMGKQLGPWAMTTDGNSLWVGGEFTQVLTTSWHLQEGIAWFPAGPDTTKPGAPAAPVAVSVQPGTVQVSAQAPLDPDDVDLGVQIYRNGTTPICHNGSGSASAVPAHSLFWRQPVVTCTDSGLTGGSKVYYTAQATELNGSNTGAMSSSSNTVTVAGSSPAYPAAVLQDAPTLYWQLGDPAGSTAAVDASGNDNGGEYLLASSNFTWGQTGPTNDGSAAVALNGGWIAGDACGPVPSSNQYAYGSVPTCNAPPVQSPTAFSLEMWFKTTSTAGGMLIGFGNNQGSPSTEYDKHVYMTTSGNLVFGVYTGSTEIIKTTGAYNDGNWHYLVATEDPSLGMALYVDGQLVGHNSTKTNQNFAGYWRVGDDSLSGWPYAPSNDAFTGTVGEVAVYPVALSACRVAVHYQASGRSISLPPGCSP